MISFGLSTKKPKALTVFCIFLFERNEGLMSISNIKYYETNNLYNKNISVMFKGLKKLNEI